jgi:hypothetical protein
MPGSTGFSPQAGGGSQGSGAGPAEGSKRQARGRKAAKVKQLRQHKHEARPLLVHKAPLLSDVGLGPPSSGRD